MLGVRYLIAVTSFFCLVTNFAVRVNLNVSIIAMVNSSAIYKESNISADEDMSCRSSTINFNITNIEPKYTKSVILPSLYTISGHWFPDFERGTLGSVIGSGLSIGTILGMSVSGLLCNSDLFGGWPSAFYIFGFSNFVMDIFWCLLVTNSPTTHPLVTEKELKYITSNQHSDMNKHVPPIPWRKVLTSVPFLSLVITQVGAEWCIYIILNDLPTFFATVLHFDIEKNGLLSSIPFPLKALIALTVGFTSDSLLRRGYTTMNFTRKFCTVFPFLWFSVGLVGVCLAGCDAALSTVLFVCTVPIIGFAVSGYNINHLDLSPEYAGTLYGIANTFSSVMGFVAPMFVGYITNEHQSLQEWYTVFGTTIAVLLFSAVIFTVFGSTEKQDWIESKSELKTIKDTLPNYNTIERIQKSSL